MFQDKGLSWPLPRRQLEGKAQARETASEARTAGGFLLRKGLPIPPFLPTGFPRAPFFP